MKLSKLDIAAAAHQGERRKDFVESHRRPCPKCHTDQIEVRTTSSYDFVWVCRLCKTEFI